MSISMRKPLGSIILIIGVLSLSPFFIVNDLSFTPRQIMKTDPLQSSPRFQIAAGPTRTGLLDAIEYVQSGINVETTGLISARTDETPSVESNLTLDVTNEWRSNQIELNVSELRKLLVLNGTFTDGYPGVNVNPSGGVPYYPLGWDADGFNKEPTKQTLRAVYNDTVTEFIELELEGEATGQPQDFKVHKDSWIYWYQDVIRSPSETDFLLSFDLLYDSGPIGPRRTDDFELRIEAGSTVLWSLDPVTISGRDLWYHIGPIPISLASAPTSFEFRFVFEIVESRTLEGDRADYDGDWDNARFLRFFVDDISLISADYIDPDTANLRVNVNPLSSTTISGSNGNGRALMNHSYWDTSPLQLSILSDEPVSFDYEARFISEFRTGNTSWTTNPMETGVGYSVDIGESPVLTSYFYVPTHGFLEGISMELTHPLDYENVTIYDATLTDVTSSCILSQNMIVISGSILDSLGWWKVTWDAPNYARKVTPQLFVMPLWENQTQFNAGDHIRALVEIGTSTSSPGLLEDLSIDWFQPNSTQWFGEISDDGIDGVAYSNQLNLDANNATPGLWEIRVFWNNETEIAYDEVSFNLFHASGLLPVITPIQADTDSMTTCAVYLRDADTNEYLLDDQSTVVGNWSGDTIVFQRNLAKSWWEGDLNTSLVGRGNFTILINATRLNYRSSNCTILVEVTSPSVFAHLGSDYVDVNLGSSYNATFRYSYTDDTGIESALIEVVSITGPMGGLGYGGTIAVPGEPGNYSIDFQVDIGGSYSITVRASKADHNTETASFNIVAAGIGTELFLLNGSSDVLNVGKDYQLALHYRNSTGEGLSGADVTIVDVVPASGLDFSATQFHGNGTYTIFIQAQDAGVYSITLRASLTGYDSQLTIFTLVVSPIPSTLSVDPVVYSITVDSNYTLVASFTNLTLHGIENASVSVLSVDPVSGLWYSVTTELGSGLYSIELVPSLEGTYNLVLIGATENYQNSTTLFTLVVTDVPTNLRTSDGLVSGFTYFTYHYEVLLIYEKSDDLAPVLGATIEISAVVGLECIVIETPQGYLVTINPSVLGRWSLSFRASKAHYRNESMIFDFEVRETVTSVSGIGPESILYLGFSYDFTLSYNWNDSVGLDNATIIQTYRGAQGNPFLWNDNGDGTYSFTIAASELGSYVASIEFSKYGYASAETTFSFNISMQSFTVPNEYLNSSYSILQGDNLHLYLRLTADDTRQEIFDAVVSFSILETETRGQFENHTDGSYTATIPVPLAAGTYTLRISLQNHQFEDMDIDIILISEVDSAGLAIGYLITGIEVSALFMGIVSLVYVSRRRQRQISARKRTELLSFRERFNDVNNIIGFLIIQRSNGLPVYSRIIKGGFEMSMISGFISAISNFAMELRTEEKLWTPIPISEIVTAVQTNELICALLTVDSPSTALTTNLEEISLLIGSRFDSDPDLITTISRHTDAAIEYKNDFDRFFETQFDYNLLISFSSYDLSRKGEYPLIELAIISGDMNRPFYVSDLVRYLVTSGIEETRAYSLVIDAAESGFLLSLDES